jgi:ribonucleotide monophosphatase NagD (HAD superfamily)
MKMLRRALESAIPKRVIIKGPVARALSMESQEMDMVKMQQFAVAHSQRGEMNTTNPELSSLMRRYAEQDITPMVGTAGPANVLYALNAEDANDDTLVDVGNVLAGLDKDAKFSMLMKDHPSYDDQMKQLLAALECIVAAHGGKVYHSLEAYFESL